MSKELTESKQELIEFLISHDKDHLKIHYYYEDGLFHIEKDGIKDDQDLLYDVVDSFIENLMQHLWEDERYIINSDVGKLGIDECYITIYTHGKIEIKVLRVSTGVNNHQIVIVTGP